MTLDKDADRQSHPADGDVPGKSSSRERDAQAPRVAREGPQAARAHQGSRARHRVPRRGGAVSPRAVIGIDLGTTHCAMSRASLIEGAVAVAVDVMQLVGPSTVEAKRLLPSFLYFGAEARGPASALLPWDA